MTFDPDKELITVEDFLEAFEDVKTATDVYLITVLEAGSTDRELFKRLLNVTSYTEGLEKLENLQDAVKSVGLGLDVYGALAAAQEGDFGPAGELPLNLVLSV